MQVGGKLVYSHRYAWEKENGPIPKGGVIDHYYCYTPQCCNVEHLRLTTQALNAANRSGASKGNTSGFRNVFRTPSGRYAVTVVKDRNDIYVGTYDSLEEAAKVASKAREELFGEFAGRG